MLEETDRADREDSPPREATPARLVRLEDRGALLVVVVVVVDLRACVASRDEGPGMEMGEVADAPASRRSVVEPSKASVVLLELSRLEEEEGVDAPED